MSKIELDLERMRSRGLMQALGPENLHTFLVIASFVNQRAICDENPEVLAAHLGVDPFALGQRLRSLLEFNHDGFYLVVKDTVTDSKGNQIDTYHVPEREDLGINYTKTTSAKAAPAKAQKVKLSAEGDVTETRRKFKENHPEELVRAVGAFLRAFAASKPGGSLTVGQILSSYMDFDEMANDYGPEVAAYALRTAMARGIFNGTYVRKVAANPSSRKKVEELKSLPDMHRSESTGSIKTGDIQPDGSWDESDF